MKNLIPDERIANRIFSRILLIIFCFLFLSCGDIRFRSFNLWTNLSPDCWAAAISDANSGGNLNGSYSQILRQQLYLPYSMPKAPLSLEYDNDPIENQYLLAVTNMLNFVQGDSLAFINGINSWVSMDDKIEDVKEAERNFRPSIYDQTSLWLLFADPGYETKIFDMRHCDLDSDGLDEIILIMPGLRESDDGETVYFDPYRSMCVIYDRKTELYIPEKVISDAEFGYDDSGNLYFDFPEILRIGDMTCDTLNEIVILQAIHGCTNHNRILAIGRWDGLQWMNLMGKYTISNDLGSIEFADLDQDGTIEVILNGGLVPSAGAGLQRTSTLTFGYIDGAFNVKDFEYSTSDHPYHLIVDAARAFKNGDFKQSLDLADSLISSNPDEIAAYDYLNIELAGRISAFAQIERMLSLVELGRVDEVTACAEQLRRLDARNNRYAEAAQVLSRLLPITGDTASACEALRESFQGIPDQEWELLDFNGYNTERIPGFCFLK